MAARGHQVKSNGDGRLRWRRRADHPLAKKDTRLEKGGIHMIKAFKKITFTLMVSSILAFNGMASGNDFWQGGKPRQDKPIERPKETPKNGGDSRGGGRGDQRDRGKKP